MGGNEFGGAERARCFIGHLGRLSVCRCAARLHFIPTSGREVGLHDIDSPNRTTPVHLSGFRERFGQASRGDFPLLTVFFRFRQNGISGVLSARSPTRRSPRSTCKEAPKTSPPRARCVAVRRTAKQSMSLKTIATARSRRSRRRAGPGARRGEPQLRPRHRRSARCSGGGARWDRRGRQR